MGLCFGERQRLKGEAHTPRRYIFAPVQRIEKWKMERAKLLVSERGKTLFSQKEMEQPHKHNRRKNSQQQMIFVFTHCTPRCTTLDTSSTCKTAASKRTQLLACGAPPLAVVTFESNLNTMNLKVLVGRCWLGKKRVVVVWKKKESSRKMGSSRRPMILVVCS